MPIFDQGYKHWEGKLRPATLAWWPIAIQGLKMQLRTKWSRLFFALGLGSSIALLSFLVIWGFVERKSSWALPILRLFSEVPEVMRDPAAFRTAIWTMIYHFFFYGQMIVLMFLIMMIGPDLISKDLRFNTFPLYFSRPVRRFEYFLGKWGVIALVVMVLTTGPALIAWIAGVLCCPDFSVIKETWFIPVGSIIIGFIAALSLGLLMLAISSMTRNSRFVTAIWLSLWIVGNIVSGSLYEGIRDVDWPMMFDLPHNLRRVEQHVMRTEEAFQTFDSIIKTASKQIPQNMPMRNQAMNFTQGGIFLDTRMRDNQLQVRGTPIRNTYPWEWSAGLLSAICLLSVVILHFRVKSLDRLR